MSGDVLAKGGKKAIFGPAQVTAKKWREIWADEEEPVKKPKETKRGE